MALAAVNVMPEWHEKLLVSRQKSGEVHLSEKCSFDTVFDWQIIGSQPKVFVLFRKCVCGLKRNKVHILEKRFINISEFTDGVEIHEDLNRRCHYNAKPLPNGQFRLEKICFCPKQKG